MIRGKLSLLASTCVLLAGCSVELDELTPDDLQAGLDERILDERLGGTDSTMGGSSNGGTTECENGESRVPRYLDQDGDGFGDIATRSELCPEEAEDPQYVENGDDCDDENEDIRPTALEVEGNAVDENCDGQLLCLVDADGDGVGDSDSTPQLGDLSCSEGGFAAEGGDCDDSDPDVLGGKPWFVDADDDGYGSSNEVSVVACTRPEGLFDADELTGVDSDCDDSEPDIHPGAGEVPGNLIDEDCNGTIACYIDADADGFGNSGGLVTSSIDKACNAGDGESLNTDDCDDSNGAISPGRSEVVGNNIDDNCDEDVVCFVDTDGDSYGASDGSTVVSIDGDCEDVGEADDDEDCDDTVAAISPDGTETVGDAVDDDCDGLFRCFRDADSDGYGSSDTIESSDAVCTDSGESDNDADCDDADPDENPAAVWFYDLDGDLYGDETRSSVNQCLRPTGGALASELTDTTNDCNDDDISINPAATDDAGDTVDEDCTDDPFDADNDGYDDIVGAQLDCDDNDDDALFVGALWYLDADGDRYSDIADVSGTTSCTRPSASHALSGTLIQVATDCHDDIAAANPAGTEVAGNAIDENCDTNYACFVDADGDGYGSSTTDSMASSDCSAAGRSENSDDCDDTEGEIHPDTLWYTDADADHFSVVSEVPVQQCSRPVDGFFALELLNEGGGIGTDCNDSDGGINPAATDDAGDAVDEDCAGGPFDQDNDGYDDVDGAADDCNDGNPLINPAAMDDAGDDVDEDCQNGPFDQDNDGFDDVDGAGDDCDDTDPLQHPGAVWYLDADDDTYSDDTDPGTTQCERPGATSYRASELTGLQSDCQDDDGDINPATIPAGLSCYTQFTQISVGTGQTCAVTVDHDLYCWGQGTKGQLGDNSGVIRDLPVQVVDSAGDPDAIEWDQVSCGFEYSCGLATDGTAYCWGEGSFAVLGHGGPQDRLYAEPVNTALKFKDISASRLHTCALAVSGEAYCWGYESNGVLGNGAHGFNPQYSPVPVNLGYQYDSISAGSSHTCAIRDTGVLYCWGRTQYGRLGNGEDGDGALPDRYSEPTEVTAVTGWTSLSAGHDHSCGMATNGGATSEPYCWGRNHEGQLGAAPLDTTNKLAPTSVEENDYMGAPDAVSFVNVVAGYEFSMGIDAAGFAYAWGHNDQDQLANPHGLANATVPYSIDHLDPELLSIAVDSVSLGDNYGCLLTTSGTPYCFGSTSQGGLGLGATTRASSPTRILFQ